MIGKILKSIFANFQTFLVIWVVVLIANQLFIFRGCFAGYCLIAALPHTSIIAALILYFYVEPENTIKTNSSNDSEINSSKNENI